jgi:integrase
MVYDFRKALDAVAIRAGFSETVIRDGEVVKDQQGRPVLRSTVKVYMLRHTYTAARLQTLDHGAPISPYTVKRELGHGDVRLVEEVYGHLGEIRHRSAEVEYRVEQHEERLRERLGALTAPA